MLWALAVFFGASVEGVDITCEFHDFADYGYYCLFERISVTSEIEIVNIVRPHLEGKTDDDVLGIAFDHAVLSFIPTEFFILFPNLRSLEMHNVGLERLDGSWFEGAVNLRNLWLEDNSIQVLPANVFSACRNLETISLGGNRITEMHSSAFSGLGQLVELYINYNQLTSIPANSFQSLANLKSLYLSNNQINALPANIFAPLRNLEELYLSVNLLERLDANLLSQNQHVKRLFFYRNSINAIAPGFFNNLTSLKTFWLNGNNCISRDFSEFDDLDTILPYFSECFANFQEANEKRFSIRLEGTLSLTEL